MANIGSLIVSLEANMTAFTASMSQAVAQTEASTARMNAVLDTAKTGVNALSSAASSLGLAFAGIGAGIGISAIAEQVHSMIENAAALERMSMATGASVEKLSALGTAAKLSGTGMDEVQAAVIKLDKGLAGAGASSSTAAHALEYLGLNAKQLQAMDPAAAMKLIADKLALVADGGGKSALAIDLLGKAGATMLPFLKALAEASSLQVKTTTEQGVAAHEYEQSLVRLQLGANAVYKAFAFEALPGMQAFVDVLTGAKTGAGDTRAALIDLTKGIDFASWGQSAGEAVASIISGGVSAIKVMTDHKTAVEAVGLAYASWKVSTFFAPLIASAIQATTAQVTMVTAAVAARTAMEQSTAKAAAEALAVLAAADAKLAYARDTVIAADGDVKLALAANLLIPALRGQEAAALAAAAANTAHATASEAASAAGMAATVAGGLARTAISALGGPIGIATTLLAAGAGAWALWGSAASQASGESDRVRQRLEQANAIMQRLAQQQKFGSGDLGALNAALEDIDKEIAVISQSRSPAAMEKLKGLRAEAAQLQQAIIDLGKVAQQAAAPAKTATAPYVGAAAANQAAAAAAALLKKGLDSRLQMFEHANAMEKTVMSNAEKTRQLAYSAEQINVTTFYAQRKADRDADLAYTVANFESEIAAWQKWQAGFKSGTKEYEEAQTAITALRGKISTARAASSEQDSADQSKRGHDMLAWYQASEQATADYYAKITAQAEAWRQRVDGIHAAALGLDSNKAAEAAALQFDAQNAATIRGFVEITNSVNRTKQEIADAEQGLADLAAQRARAIENASTDWVSGSTRAFRTYADNAANAAAQAQTYFSNAFKGMEDALVTFMKTGKLSFTSLADSIITDLIRIQVQTQIMAPLVGTASNPGILSTGLSSLAGGASSWLGGLFGKAAGGPVGAGSMYQVAENGPELLTSGGNTYLMMGKQGGNVIPSSAASNAAGSGGVVINVTESPGNGGKVSQSSQGGQNIIDILVERVKGAVGSDIAKGGAIATQLQQRYGLSPAMGAVR